MPPWTFLLLPGLSLLVWSTVILIGRARGLPDVLGPAPASEQDAALTPVAIVCPGRNEAEHLPTTLPALLNQDHPNHTVVFIDDASDDDTPRITAEHQGDPRLRAVRLDGHPPEGWVGKTWAIHRGLEHVPEDAEWLCFTDADLPWHPPCLRAAHRAAVERNLDVVGLFPRLEFGSFLEAVVQTQMILALGVFHPPHLANNPDKPHALTGGAFIFVRRSLYEKIGGHEAVKGQVLEDLALGRALKAGGGRQWIARAPELFTCRMYDGWADMWEGLTKNSFAAIGFRPLVLARMLVSVTLSSVLPPVYLLLSLIWLVVSPGALSGAALGLSLAAWGVTAAAMHQACRQLERPGWERFCMPIGAAIMLAITTASAWRYYTGGSVWKGRRYGPAVQQAGS